MVTQTDPEILRQQSFRAHRRAAIRTDHCNTAHHRKDSCGESGQVDASHTNDEPVNADEELELIDFRYEALLARIVLEELFCDDAQLVGAVTA